MITLNSIMNFEAGQDVKNNGLYYTVKSISGRLVVCERKGVIKYFFADDLEIVESKRVCKLWSAQDIIMVELNLHLSNLEIAQLIGRTESAVENFKALNNLKKVA